MQTLCGTIESNTRVVAPLAVLAVFDELPVMHLRDLADRRGWTYLAEPRIGHVLRAVRATDASAIVVHVSPTMVNQAGELLAALRNYWVKLGVVATARDEDMAIEMAVRQAGVSSFVPCDGDTLLLECCVANCVKQKNEVSGVHGSQRMPTRFSDESRALRKSA